MVAKAFIIHSRVAGLASLGAWALVSGCAAHRPVADTAPQDIAPPQNEREPVASAPQASNSVDAQDARQARTPLADDARAGFHEVGEASYYSSRFQGRRTASGERYDMHALTAAHRTLPLGSYVRVSNLSGTKSVIVRINDRGPFTKSRVIDLSFAAASLIGLQHAGRAQVVVEPVRSAESVEPAESVGSIRPVSLQLRQPASALATSASVKPVTLHISHGRRAAHAAHATHPTHATHTAHARHRTARHKH
ncbi:septal ring lytic transglycosylase RlpA family protein [Caballeronia sp. Lep1P3]|uniref:septal ring lytic transglycosylase RlpA family protein n=1 Tax=Caballeronia sp. Lep1P3 TaxID=2878150 RepID=UPI001FD3A6E3|nr:septal ring lytic transglycosylase RlpA family protein [Caballeronia sp. Lep1P3]